MKKIIPFKKEIKFDNNLYEVTSISLEHTLHKEDKNIVGSFIVSGEYRITETSVNTLSFSYDLPFMIDVDEKYDITGANIDIDDFYYEIVDNKYLNINIDVKLDNIEEIIIEKEEKEDRVEEAIIEENEVTCIEEEDEDILPREKVEEPSQITSEEVKSLFNNIDSEDNYVTYKIYIVREGDTKESIMNKYNMSQDEIESYNDLSDIKIGDKIIIPYVKNK